MSIDLDVVCLTCKKYTHLGQYSAGCVAFGYSSQDLEGRAAVGEFVLQHLGTKHDLRIIRTDDVPDDCVAVKHEDIVNADELKEYRERAAHEVVVRRSANEGVIAGHARKPLGAGTGGSVLEAVGDYAVRQQLVRITETAGDPLHRCVPGSPLTADGDLEQYRGQAKLLTELLDRAEIAKATHARQHWPGGDVMESRERIAAVLEDMTKVDKLLSQVGVSAVELRGDEEIPVPLHERLHRFMTGLGTRAT